AGAGVVGAGGAVVGGGGDRRAPSIRRADPPLGGAARRQTGDRRLPEVCAVKLPIVDGGATCFSCDAPCCTSYVVPIHGFDLWRMVRGLQLPWSDVADARAGDWDGFAVDASETRLSLFLRAREGEVCRFLLTLPSGLQRCGAHSARPMACRVYPWQ